MTARLPSMIVLHGLFAMAALQCKQPQNPPNTSTIPSRDTQVTNPIPQPPTPTPTIDATSISPVDVQQLARVVDSSLDVVRVDSAPTQVQSDAGVANRSAGGVQGQIVPERFEYVVGEPIIAVAEFRNSTTTEIRFNWGGDRFGRYFQTRYNVKVWNEQGNLICDLARPDGVGRAGGGPGNIRTIPPQGSYQETLLLNDTCRDLLTPGRYRLSVTRVLSLDETLVRRDDAGQLQAWCSTLTPPDLTTLAPGSPDPYNERSSECVEALRRFPIITSDFRMVIQPWNAVLLRQRITGIPAAQTAAAQARNNSREAVYSDYGGWYCNNVVCNCSQDVLFQRVDDWLTRAVSVVPDTFAGPTACHH